MKNNYPRNFINKTLTKIPSKPENNIPNEQPKQSRTRITLPYINNTSEVTARLSCDIHDTLPRLSTTIHRSNLEKN